MGNAESIPTEEMRADAEAGVDGAASLLVERLLDLADRAHDLGEGKAADPDSNDLGQDGKVTGLLAEAEMWANRLVASGNFNPMKRIIKRYQKGAGATPRNLPKTIHLMSKVADAGCAESKFVLAQYYIEPEDSGLEYDFARHLELLKEAAEGGDCDAMFQLAKYTADGTGVPKSAEGAFLWLKRGAELGHPGCLAQAALALTQGIGCEVDAEKGCLFAFQALHCGGPAKAAGAAVLAKAYKNGAGVHKCRASSVAMLALAKRSSESDSDSD